VKSWKLSCVVGIVVVSAAAIVPATIARDVRSALSDTGSGRPVPPSVVPVDLSPTTTEAGRREGRKKPETAEPLFVKPLVAIESGRNDSNPVWSPQGTFIAFERSIGDKKEIRVTLSDGTPVQTVFHLLSWEPSDMKFFIPGVSDETSYNAGITWAPDELRFVFMSNGGEGNYDIYLLDLGGSSPVRLTQHREKDGQAQWSPVEDRIVFVSGRTGNGDIYLCNLTTRVLTRLTRGGKAYLYPQWSPDGKKLVMMHGSNENHDIIMISDLANPMGSRRKLTTWTYDDLRPVWSPDGKKIAFYSNYNAAGDPRMWSLFVIAADGSDPTEGEGLASKAVAIDVVADVSTGPAWMPDSNRIIYVKNDRQEYNPLYVADVRLKTSTPLKTDTKMNHDVSCARDGTIAFRAQVDQWDQIFVAKLKD
jgi:Tol biopolymer transport system component